MTRQDFDYNIYITLSDDMDQTIPFADWLDYVKTEPGLCPVDNTKTVSATWIDQDFEYERKFVYEDGLIISGFLYFDNPEFDPNVTVAGIRKMLAIAEHFGAKVIDEECLEYRANGEIYTGKWIYHPETIWERWRRYWRGNPITPRNWEKVLLGRWDEIPFKIKASQRGQSNDDK